MSFHARNLHSALSACAILSLCLPSVLRAADTPKQESLLVLKDGQRVAGSIVGEEGDLILVQTRLFGLQRIPRELLAPTTGTEVPGPAPASGEAPPAPAAVAQPSAAEPGSATLPKTILPQPLYDFLSTWHAGINLAIEAKNDGIQRNSLLVELKADRRFSMDELRATASHERVKENEKLTTYMTKGELYWRHDLNKRWFTLYAPKVEWNRNYVLNDIRFKYLLLQQRVGAGYTFLDTTRFKLRAGLAENFMNLWIEDYWLRASDTAESFFTEADLKLPFHFRITDSINYYYSFRTHEVGADNYFEITKDLSESFKIRIRHEYRSKLPVQNVSDFNLWRIIFGLQY